MPRLCGESRRNSECSWGEHGWGYHHPYFTLSLTLFLVRCLISEIASHHHPQSHARKFEHEVEKSKAGDWNPANHSLILLQIGHIYRGLSLPTFTKQQEWGER